jgi:hypothetical protein
MLTRGSPYPSSSDEEIEKDNKFFVREATRGNEIFKSHAIMLLKSLEYWRLRRDTLKQRLDKSRIACDEAT